MSESLTIVLGTGIGAFLFAYIGSKMHGKHYVLQTLFIFFSLLLMINSVAIMNELYSGGLLENYLTIMMIGFYISIVYYFVFYLLEVFNWINSRGEHNGKRKGKSK